jgi:hypothetical protein
LHGGVIEGGWRAAANLPRALLAEIDRRSRRRGLLFSQRPMIGD